MSTRSVSERCPIRKHMRFSIRFHARHGGGKVNGERAAAIGPRAMGFDAAAVHLGELLDDGEPDAQAAFAARDRAFSLREKLEHFRKPLGANAHAVVLYA